MPSRILSRLPNKCLGQARPLMMISLEANFLGMMIIGIGPHLELDIGDDIDPNEKQTRRSSRILEFCNVDSELEVQVLAEFKINGTPDDYEARSIYQSMMT